MKRKILQNLLILAGIAMLPLAISSCSDDPDPVAAPEAGFTTEIVGKTVTVTNTATGADSFAYDFGDGSAVVSDENPSHTYAANGEYIINQTVTNATGSDEKNEVVSIVNIQIDGDFADWADVPAIDMAGDGSLKTIKVENLNNSKLFFYIEGDATSTSFLDLYLNLDYANTADGDTTGLNTNVYPMSNNGYDVLFEGFFGHTNARETWGMFYGIFYYPSAADEVFANNLDFGTRQEPTLDPNHITYTDMTPVGSDGNVAYEFVIDMNFFPADRTPEVGAEIQFFIDEWNNDPASADGSTWWGGFSGHFPTGQATEDGMAATYLIK